MLNADITARITARQTGTNDFGGPTFNPKIEKLIALANGTLANQADILWADERTVADGGTDLIDLAGAFSDAFGNVLTAAEMVAIMLVNQARDGTANTTALSISAGANPVFSFSVPPIQPGGVFLLGSGDAEGMATVTAGTGDEIAIVNEAGAANTYQIMIVGRSA